MWRFVAVLACVVGVFAAAAPQDAGRAGEAPEPRVSAPSAAVAPGAEQQVKEVARSEIVNADGSFNFSFELSNGVRVEESGYVKREPQAAGRSLAATDGDQGEDTGEINVAQGSYTYTAPDGTVISLSYTADENGFQPRGEHLPTPPPAIQRALAALAAGEVESGGRGAGAAPPPQGLTGRSVPAVAVPSSTASSSTPAPAATEAPSEAPSSDAMPVASPEIDAPDAAPQ